MENKDENIDLDIRKLNYSTPLMQNVWTVFGWRSTRRRFEIQAKNFYGSRKLCTKINKYGIEIIQCYFDKNAVEVLVESLQSEICF